MILVALVFILGTLNYINLKKYYNAYAFLWLCNTAPFLFVIGEMTHNAQLIKAVINILFFPHLVAFFGISYQLITKKTVPILSFIEFKTRATYLLFILIHILAVILLFFTVSIEPTPISLLYSFSILLLTYVLTLKLTPQSENINLIHKSNFKVSIPGYSKIWVILLFVCLVLPAYLLQKILSGVFG